MLSILDRPRGPGRSPRSAPAGKVAESIERVYGPGARSTRSWWTASRSFASSRAGALLGFAQVRNVKGKEQPITYLVAVDSTGATRDMDILVYREAQGGEVAYDAWRKQFRGKTAADPLAGWQGHPEHLGGHDQLQLGDPERAPGAGPARRLARGGEASSDGAIGSCPGARLRRRSGRSGSGSRSSRSWATPPRSSSSTTRPA